MLAKEFALLEMWVTRENEAVHSKVLIATKFGNDLVGVANERGPGP